MEQQLWQAEALAKEQAGQLQAVQAREAQLEQQVTALTGQHNIHQRIQHHQKVKDENNALRSQVAACRDDLAKQSIRSALYTCTHSLTHTLTLSHDFEMEAKASTPKLTTHPQHRRRMQRDAIADSTAWSSAQCKLRLPAQQLKPGIRNTNSVSALSHTGPVGFCIGWRGH